MGTILNNLADFALQTADHLRTAVQDKALQTAQQLDLVERSELEALKARVAHLEDLLAAQQPTAKKTKK